MNDPVAAAPTQLETSENQLWELPLGASARLAEELAYAAPGAYLEAPALVDLERRTTLPILAGFSAARSAPGTPAELARHFASRAVVHAIDPATGDARVALIHDENALQAPRHLALALSSETETHDAERAAEPARERAARLVHVSHVELRSRLALGWRPAELLVTLLWLDRTSARARVRLAMPTRFDGAALERFAREKRAANAPVTPWPDAFVLSTERARQSPAVPETEGLALSIDPVVPLGEGSAWRLFGAFNLKLRAGQRGAAVQIVVPGERPSAHNGAVVPIDLLVLGTKTRAPAELALRVPIREWPSSDRVSGYFALDLSQVLPDAMAHGAETFFVYAFSGESMVGPLSTTRVGEGMLASPLL